MTLALLRLARYVVPDRETHDGTDRVYAREPKLAMDATRSGLETRWIRAASPPSTCRQTARIWPVADGKYLLTPFPRYQNTRKNPQAEMLGDSKGGQEGCRHLSKPWHNSALRGLIYDLYFPRRYSFVSLRMGTGSAVAFF